MATIDDIFGRKPHSAVMPDPPQASAPKEAKVEEGKALRQQPTETPTPPQPNATAARPTETTQSTVTPTAVGSQPPGTPATDTSGWTDYAAMVKGLNDKYDEEIRRNAPLTAEQEERQRKRRKRDERIAAIGDGISALANLYFTSKDAPNAYSPKTSLSEKARERWERITNEREGKRRAYLNAAIGKYKIGKDKADADALAAYRERQAAIKKQAADDTAKKAAAKQAADDKEKEWQHKFKEDKAKQDDDNKGKDRKLKEKQMGEAARHNRAMEAIAAKNASTAATKAANSSSGSGGKSGKKTNYTIRLNDGSVHTYSPDKTGAISSLAPTMIDKADAAAERYSLKGQTEKRKHYKALSEKLKKAGSKEALAAIVAANVWDFPTMDADIRRIIGVSHFDKSRYKKGVGAKPLD